MSYQLDAISKYFRDFELLVFERDFAKNCGKYSNTKQEFVDTFGYENQQHYSPYAFFKDSLEYKVGEKIKILSLATFPPTDKKEMGCPALFNLRFLMGVI